mgnify:CR=1
MKFEVVSSRYLQGEQNPIEMYSWAHISILTFLVVSNANTHAYLHIIVIACHVCIMIIMIQCVCVIYIYREREIGDMHYHTNAYRSISWWCKSWFMTSMDHDPLCMCVYTYMIHTWHNTSTHVHVFRDASMSTGFFFLCESIMYNECQWGYGFMHK